MFLLLVLELFYNMLENKSMDLEINNLNNYLEIYKINFTIHKKIPKTEIITFEMS